MVRQAHHEWVAKPPNRVISGIRRKGNSGDKASVFCL